MKVVNNIPMEIPLFNKGFTHNETPQCFQWKVDIIDIKRNFSLGLIGR